MDKDLQNLSDGMASVEEKILKFMEVSLPYIVLTVSVAMTIVKSFFSFGLANPFTPQFWIDLGMNILSTMATYAAFCIHGSKTYKATNTAYKSNLETWGNYSADIRKNYATRFAEFCRDYAKKCALAKRKARFEKRTLYSWEEFESKYAKLSNAQLKSLYKSGAVSQSDYIAFRQAKKPVRAPRISATAILCGSNAVSVENISQAKRNYVAQSIAARPFAMLMISAGFAIVTPTFLGMPAASVVFSIVVSCFMILVAAVTGNTAGNTGARRDSADIKSRIFFLDTFMDEQKKASSQEGASSIFTTT